MILRRSRQTPTVSTPVLSRILKGVNGTGLVSSKRIPVRLRKARKILIRWVLRSDCDFELNDPPSTVEGAQLGSFRGSRADRLGRWLRTLGNLGTGETGPVAEPRAGLIVAAFAVEGVGLAWYSIPILPRVVWKPHRFFGSRDPRRKALEQEAFLTRFGPGALSALSGIV